MWTLIVFLMWNGNEKIETIPNFATEKSCEEFVEGLKQSSSISVEYSYCQKKAVYNKNNPKPAKNYPTDIAGIKPEWEGATRIILGKEYTSVTNPNGSLGWKEVKGD